jgi:hypothetical protein
LKQSSSFFASFLLILILFAPLAAQNQQEIVTTPFSTAPYMVGERLTYNVSFSNFLSAAHVELFIAGRGTFFNRDGLQIQAHVETTEVVNAALYSINKDFISYVDPNTGMPFRATQIVREGERTSDVSVDYNTPVGISAIPAKLRLGEFPGTYDLVSMLYRLRALPLTEGSTYFFNVRNDTDEYAAELKVIGRELTKTNVGSFNALVTQVRVRNNSEVNNYRLRIYFSDDERHVPVLITARHPAGEIRAELVGSEMLEITAPPAQAIPVPNVTTMPNTPQTNVTRTPTNPPQPNTSQPRSTTSTEASGETPAGLPFKVGEQLNFNVFLANSAQPVGTASFQVRPRAKYFGRDGILLAAKAQTVGAAQRLFNANDQINSYVSPTTLAPFRTELLLQEGRRRVNQTNTVDQDRGSAVTDKGLRIEIPVGTHDFVSVFYALRSFNLTPPRRNAVSLLVNTRPRTLFITSLKRENIELGGQTIAAIQLSLTTDDPQQDKYALRLWVSDDRRRLPLRITATTELGPLRADLAIIPVTQQ